MNFNSILIITYGRSGSTLLQGLLNANSDCIIRGENYNFCYYLFKAYQSIVYSQVFDGKSPTSPWYGNDCLNERIFLSQIKNLMYKFLVGNVYEKNDPKVNCYGFKEIRYSRQDIGDDFDEYLEFLRKIFPNVAFVFNTRNLTDVIKSGWWSKQEPDDVIDLLKSAEDNFINYIKKNPQFSYHITYEDIINKSNKLKGLFDFIGMQFNLDIIERVLKTPHSFNYKQLL